MAFSTAVEPAGVMIGVRGGAMVCMLPPCMTRPCATAESWSQRWQEENRASQRCVRELIAQIGGTAIPDVFGVNFVAAKLTWSQIQEVAAHPHVSSIEGDGSGTPPP